jgi:hypothetical protein
MLGRVDINVCVCVSVYVCQGVCLCLLAILESEWKFARNFDVVGLIIGTV